MCSVPVLCRYVAWAGANDRAGFFGCVQPDRADYSCGAGSFIRRYKLQNLLAASRMSLIFSHLGTVCWGVWNPVFWLLLEAGFLMSYCRTHGEFSDRLCLA